MSASEISHHSFSSQNQRRAWGIRWLFERLIRAAQGLGLRKFAQGKKTAVVPGAADRDLRVQGDSEYPLAVDISRVGYYPARVHSGGGYIYDDVLEYRVWLHPERGAVPRAGEGDYFLAFAQYELALEFAMSEAGAEAPLVLVRQLKHLNEPEPGVLEMVEGERLTEWQVEWIAEAREEE
ncbi:MAG TPA: hypothetical protein VK956_17705 [Verrucomicrobium sp.]|nr:hypothetical protein [Verrucomicrobium sp.]